jgi:hypothetical protein
MRVVRWIFVGVLLAGGLWVGFHLGRWWQRAHLEEVVRQQVITTLQRESAESFLVVGSLDIVATVEASSHKQWLGLDLGTTTARVRVPGRVYYGFDVRALQPEHIRLTADRVVEVVLPLLTLQAVEPNLEALQIETEVGWARLYRSSGRRMEQAALRQVNDALRAQAEAYLATQLQPHYHAAQAVRTLLRPILGGLGLDSLQVQLITASRILVEESP